MAYNFSHEKISENTNDKENASDEKLPNWAESFLGFVYSHIVSFACICMVLALIGCYLDGKNDDYAFENGWSVVQGTSVEAVVTKSQLSASLGKYTTYYSYVTIETANGEKATFSSYNTQKTPIAGLSVGDTCTACVKQYSGEAIYGEEIKDGDTAWFINDELVSIRTEEEMSELFLKDF